ncbi:MAG: (4Fe-4S)-binding protein [Streptococcaceae bacterium]|jgi:uncharacterized Fe-S cluster protein YjdI|nr:(4Fe-4S)-binding protein [Streptococcaceae bacterium]MCH4176111.1 (4Fe-4S)-binding protein [Streptococcaceae bacterium]
MEGNQINYQPVTADLLLALGYRKYSGEKLDVYYSSAICGHVGNCVRGNPHVFQVGRRPWIISDNGNQADTIRVINSCPTGALKYMIKN